MSTILCFSTVDWDYLWHRPQALMSRFALDGHRILYVDTLGLRSPQLRDWPRIITRLRNRLRARGGGLRQPEAGVFVYSPLVLPFLDSRLARRVNVHYLVPRLKRQLARLGGGEVIVWVYLPTWTVLECVRRIPHRRLVYEAIDALASNPAGVSRGYAAAEEEILRRAGLVIATSESLCQEKAAHNANAHWVPSGVEEGFFAAGEIAAEVAGLPGPRVGFFGTLDHRLDLGLMRELARAYRGWSFVLIGAARGDLGTRGKQLAQATRYLPGESAALRGKSFPHGSLGELLAEENVHFLGPKPHGELPRYLRGLDVLYLPYVVDEFTRHVYPAKIFECLALGKPVVATALPALREFGEVVRLAEGWEGFARALREAVAEEDAGLREKRVALARQNSWEARYQQIRGLVEGMMGERRMGDGRMGE